MKAVGVLYDLLSVVLSLGSFGLFYQGTQFLVDKDYIAATLCMLAGFGVLRAGVEMGRLALVVRRRARESGREP